MTIAVNVLADGPRNCTVRVTGVLGRPLEPTPIYAASVGLRFDRAVWLIQEKMGLALWWANTGQPEHLLLLMESRNSVNYSPGIGAPPGWDHQIWLTGFGFDRVPDAPAIFCFTMDFDKQA